MIERDIHARLEADNASYAQVLLGTRQCGKSTLYHMLSGKRFKEVTLDDLRLRQLAEQDPALFLRQFEPPVVIDEAQYAPNLFPEIKRVIDQLKQNALNRPEASEADKVLIRLTGSNQVLMDQTVKETLVGRASYYYLNTLTVHEILQSIPEQSVLNILFQGGWPEIYQNPAISIVQYLNDYIRSYIEKEIILSAGIKKQNAFHTVLAMLAARTGTFIEYSNIAKDSGVQSVTIKEWVSLLERNQIIALLPVYSSNINKRLIKTPKLYFLDTGLAARLQGWSEALPMLNSPQAGLLFETLVFAEMTKFIENMGKDWKLMTWRTKEKAEIDFVLQLNPGHYIALDAKLAMQSVQPAMLPSTFKKDFPDIKKLVLVTLGEYEMQLSPECCSVPITQLHDFLLSL